MSSLDIVNLIEKNPITKLSGTYNSNLLTKIKENFTETQQQLFVTSFYCYLNYDKNTDFVIDLDNIWKWLGFTQKVNAKTLLEKNFIIETDYKCSLLLQQKQKKEGRGGNNHQTFMLNIKTFKLFCIKAGTHKSNEIHEYFIKLEEILQDTIQEESNELKLQLEQKGNELLQIEIRNKEYLKEIALEKHKKFIQDFQKLNVVYLFLLQMIGDKMIIKIGSTQNIKDRAPNLSNGFLNEILIIDVVQSDNHTKFEYFLHHHEFIKKFSHPIEMKNTKMTTETYLIDKGQYNEFIKIIQHNKADFQKKDIEFEEIALEREKISVRKEEIALEREKLKNENLKLKNENLKIEQEKYKNNIIIQKVEEESDDDTQESDDDETVSELESETDINLATCNYTIKKRNTNKRAPKVYQYNVNDLTTPIHIYNNPMDVDRALSNISPSALKRAYENNTIYKDFRWNFVYINEEVPNTISKTVVSRQTQEVKMLAMIDINKTKILQVFSTQKQAVEARNMKCNSFTRAIKQYSLSSGHYWNYFDNCSIEMKTEYLSHSKLPEKHIPTSGKVVEQIDPRTNEVIAKYYSNREITKKFQMSVLSLKKASETGAIHNGYKWRVI